MTKQSTTNYNLLACYLKQLFEMCMGTKGKLEQPSTLLAQYGKKCWMLLQLAARQILHPWSRVFNTVS